MQGQLKKVFRTQQYGFIRSGQKDYFFHKSDFDGHWEDLCMDFEAGVLPHLTFDVEQAEKGPRAVGVRLVSNVPAI